jgi:hypothetical protein
MTTGKIGRYLRSTCWGLLILALFLAMAPQTNGASPSFEEVALRRGVSGTDLSNP